MKQFLIICFAFFVSASLSAQSSKNSVQLEFGGHGSFYTINYERILFDFDWTKTTAQIGVGYYPKSTGMIPLWMPVTINQMFRIYENQFVELGGGMMLINDGIEFQNGEFKDNYQFRSYVFRLGYRLHSKNGKWIFRGGYTPIWMRSRFPVLEGTENIGFLTDDFVHWAGVAVGYRF